jgi:hypothetical protein
MDKEKGMAETLKQYQEASKNQADVDMASLAIKLLEQQHSTKSTPQSQKIWGYLISLFLPPFGLIFAVRFYFMSDKDDAKKTALICLVLTALSIFITSLLIQFVFSSSGISPAQIQSLDPNEIEYILQE